MDVNVKFKLRVSRKSLLLTSLLVVILTSFCFISVFNGVSSFALGASDKIVNNETELRNAVVDAPNRRSTTIVLNKDIALTNSSLIIPADKDITLTSNKASGFCELIGAEGRSTIDVSENCVLKLDGIIITHTKSAGVIGGGIYVATNGKLVLYSGEIFGNSAVDYGAPYSWRATGGGVYNLGVFEMYGGKISNNSATSWGTSVGGYGGGVYNNGTFTMSGGEITYNLAHAFGGGVYNEGTFNQLGGTISGKD